MTQTSSILKIGNSCGIIIPAKIMKSLSLTEKDKVSISDSGGRIILQKITEGSSSPFAALDAWYEEKGYPIDNNVESSLEYVKAIKDGRKEKEIPKW